MRASSGASAGSGTTSSIGDDWKIAAAVVLVLAIGAALVMAGLGGALLAPVLAVGVAVAFTGAILLDVRSR